ncbi:MAG TPA: DNA polymerase III subunit gamma/tau, partial [Polyangiaceae bacterium]|nr:DNA polymerase III subunit gamma/tau [Polyangiaceae bacterium]
MSYVVLARKWRPMRFDDLVGQDHVARTLGNAIQTGRVAHAFLFTGVRGVGKTTSARILAKALNCLGDPETTPPGTDPGPTIQPCLKCAACLEIASGSDVDVWEIDGASYNGIDEVRKLQDSLPYRPQRDRYKIFIVDEVHMLSQSAWNAFLKTLEEPPPHVKFIFATTEVHKVPVTILSRVQRFDFKLISQQAIAGRLRHVLSVEKIQADDAAVALLAREAAGSMRDAMSLLDQVIAWGGEALVGKDVAKVLGVASRSVLHELAQALVGGKPERCLALVGELAEQGYDLVHVARDLLSMLRDLVVAKVCETPGELLDLPAEEAKDVQALAREAGPDDLLRLHQGFAQGFDDVARSGQPRAALEMLLVRLARRPPLLPIDELLGRLGALERRLSGAAPAPSRDRSPAPRAEAPRLATVTPLPTAAASPPRSATPSSSASPSAPSPSPSPS